jgi:CRP-like cAMP-binding protein
MISFDQTRTTNSLLNAMSADAAAYLLSSGRRVNAPVGHNPMNGDSDGRSVYFPESGLISVLWTGSDGRIAETAVVGSDGAVGFVEAMAQQPLRSSLRAVIAGSGWMVSAAAVRTVVSQERAVAAQAWRYVGRMSREAHHATACRALHAVPARLADSLLNYAERTGAFERVSLTHEALAWSLGVCRTTVTTMMRRLIADGLVRPGRGRIAIVDFEGLDAVACGCRRGALERGERRAAPAQPASPFGYRAAPRPFKGIAPQP